MKTKLISFETSLILIVSTFVIFYGSWASIFLAFYIIIFGSYGLSTAPKVTTWRKVLSDYWDRYRNGYNSKKVVNNSFLILLGVLYFVAYIYYLRNK